MASPDAHPIIGAPGKAATYLQQEVLLELVSRLPVGLVLAAVLDEGVEVKAQVAHLVAQLLTSLSPADAESCLATGVCTAMHAA